MITKNLIQAAANVVKITRLAKGDVVKMIENPSYSDPEVYYGVVIDLFNDGDKTFIQLLRYQKVYNDVKADIKTYSGDKELALFPATPEEVREHLEESVKSLGRKIEEQSKELQNKIEAHEKARAFVEGEIQKELKATSYEVLPIKDSPLPGSDITVGGGL